MNTPEIVTVEAPAETCVHITGVVSRDLSPDGQTAMIVFNVAGMDGAPERKFAITFPAAQSAWLRGIINDVVADVGKRGMDGQNSKLLHFPKLFSIGWSDGLRGPITAPEGHVILQPGHGATMIIFDTNEPNEQVFVISNLAALQMADNIRKDVMPRLTMTERNDMKLVRPSQPLGGIIRPGG